MTLATITAPLTVAAFDWSKMGLPIAIAIGILLVYLLLGHFIAAKLLISDWTVGRVLAALALHIILAAIMIPVNLFLALAGPAGIGLAGILVIIVAGAITAGIYKVSIARGIVYDFAVVFAVAGLGWATGQLVESKYSPLPYIFGKGADATADGKPVPAYATSQEAQAAAVERYPELGKAGSAFNTRFLEKHRVYREKNDPLLQSPNWPLTIAKEVADELKVP